MFRDCNICGRPIIAGRTVDNVMTAVDAKPVGNASIDNFHELAVLKGDLANEPTVIHGVRTESAAEFWHVPFDSKRYSSHNCPRNPQRGSSR